MNEPSSASSSPAVDANIPQWMNNSFAAPVNMNNNSSIQQRQPQQHNARKPKRNRNNSDNQKIVSGRSFKRLRLDHTNSTNMGGGIMSSTQSTGSVSHLSMGGAGKFALVLFDIVNSCVQHEVSVIWPLHLPFFDCPCNPHVLTQITNPSLLSS